MDPPGGNFFSNPQEWTNHPKRVKVLKVPEVDRPPEGENSIKSTKWMDPPKDENSIKSTKWTDHPRRVKVLTCPVHGRT